VITNSNFDSIDIQKEKKMSRKICILLSLVLVAAFALSACGAKATPTAAPVTAAPATAAPATAAPATAAPEPVTINWYHITTAENQKAVWQKLADEYMAAHPNVTINITVMENEAFKTKLATLMQSGEPPDIFQSWGGGTMNAYADAGLLKDITADLVRMAAPGAIRSRPARWVSTLTRD
jgi:raffinose/stachyose/melibiose transport system substrate-binding protein